MELQPSSRGAHHSLLTPGGAGLIPDLPTECCWELKASRLIITGAEGGETAHKAALNLDKKLFHRYGTDDINSPSNQTVLYITALNTFILLTKQLKPEVALLYLLFTLFVFNCFIFCLSSLLYYTADNDVNETQNANKLRKTVAT